jgi:hypothetical protein
MEIIGVLLTTEYRLPGRFPLEYGWSRPRALRENLYGWAISLLPLVKKGVFYV